jgi:hypothetical protein
MEISGTGPCCASIAPLVYQRRPRWGSRDRATRAIGSTVSGPCYPEATGTHEMLNLNRSPDIVEAIAVLDDGREVALVQKSLGKGGPSQCLFFEKFAIDGFEIQLRLDWNRLDENGDPTLDADVYEGEKKYLHDRDKWHHTPKKLTGEGWLYDWEFRGLRRRFKVQTTMNKHILAKSSILAAPQGPFTPEEAQSHAEAEEKLRKLFGTDDPD